MSFIRQTQGRHGHFYYNVNDQYIGRSLHLYGEWSEAEVHLFGQIVRPGDVVLEAGANIGSHTVALSRLAGPTGRVHAFEPQAQVHQLLCANLVANGCQNAWTYQCAVGAQDGSVEMADVNFDAPNNFGAVSLHLQGFPTRPVPIRTIDTLGLSRLDFLKADIEGFEPQMLAGAVETLQRCRPIVFIESVNPHTGDCSEALRDHFTALGYQCWHYITPLFNPHNHAGWPHDEFKDIWSFDMLCVPSGRGVAIGLDDAQTHPARCTDPKQWCRARFERLGGTD